MRKRNLIVFSLIICIICNVLGVYFTQAWFVSGGNIGEGQYTAAKVSYLPDLEPDLAQKAVYGALISGNTQEQERYIIPGDELIEKFSDSGNTTDGKLSLENFSTVDTNVRAVITCELSNSDGTAEDMNLFSWKQISENRFQYGMTDSKGVHMGMLEVDMASGTVGTTSAPGYTPPVDSTPYKWTYIKGNAPADADQISFADSWDLMLNDNQTIPMVQKDIRQVYNVITSVKLVGEHSIPDYQDEFNQFFSDHYADRHIKITIGYYAKQLAGMQWDMFTKAVYESNTPLI